MNQKCKIKVLLYADRKVGNSLVIERVIYNLKQSLKAANIDFTEDIDDEYDIAHFLSARDIIANESTLIKNKAPIILHGFCDYEDFEITSLGNYALKKETERVDNLVDAILVGYNAQKTILRHMNISTPIVVLPPASEYKIDKKNKYNLCAFRKCYGLDENTPVIINFGVYNPDNGFNDYESLARIMPDVEFFFFGARNGLFNASEHYNKASSLTNLHYEEMLPYELYDSAICTTSAIVLTGQFHVESVILHEAMNNGLPIISAKNGMLFDLLVNDKTATIVDNFDSLYNAVVNINKNEVILDNAKELTNTFDYEKKGQALKEMYEKIIEESN